MSQVWRRRKMHEAGVGRPPYRSIQIAEERTPVCVQVRQTVHLVQVQPHAVLRLRGLCDVYAFASPSPDPTTSIEAHEKATEFSDPPALLCGQGRMIEAYGG